MKITGDKKRKADDIRKDETGSRPESGSREIMETGRHIVETISEGVHVSNGVPSDQIIHRGGSNEIGLESVRRIEKGEHSSSILTSHSREYVPMQTAPALTIPLTSEQRADLQSQADAYGLNLLDFARRRLLGKLPAEPEKIDPGAELAAIFAQWSAEDAKMTPEEIAREEAGWKEIERSLVENPVTLRPVDVGTDA